MEGAAVLSARHEWIKYVIVSVLVHGALLSIPAAMKAPPVPGPIEVDVYVMREDSTPSTAGSRVYRDRRNEVRHRDMAGPKARKRAVVRPERPPVQGMERHRPVKESSPGNVPSAPGAPVNPPVPERGIATGGGQGVSGMAARGGTGLASAANGVEGRGGGPGGGETGDGESVGFGAPGGPCFLHRAVPEYPFLARRRKKEGSVVLMVAVDAAGKLTKVDVVEASDEIFVESSLEAVKKSTFLPASRSGRPVMSKALLPIRFSLTD